jgi:hypothetical protein
MYFALMAETNVPLAKFISETGPNPDFGLSRQKGFLETPRR